MFNNKKNALTLRSDATVPTVISSDISIIGNLVSEGVVEIAGRIEGNIKCDRLNLHPTGLIKGDIIARETKLNGEIHGVIKAKQVNLSEKAKIHGFIIYETLSVAPGAVVFGQIKQSDREDIAEEHIQTATPIPAPAAATSGSKEAASGTTTSGRKMRLVNKE